MSAPTETTTAQRGSRPPVSWRSGVLLVMRRLVGFDLRRYVVGGLLWSLFFVVPLLTGLILKGLFDQISGHSAAGLDTALWLCAAFVAAEAARGGVFWFAVNIWPYWWIGAGTMLRSNALRSILTARGPAASRLPHSSGEAVSRFRDDVEDLVIATDNGVDLIGAVLFGIGAFAIMTSIDPVITVVLVLPLTVVVVLIRVLSEVIRRIHARARELGAAVTAFVGETFAGVLAIKTAGAENAVLDRLRAHNRRRRQAAVKDRLAMDMLDTVTGATVEVSIGLVLLLAAPAMRRGDFTVGDLALFTSYVGWLTMLPRILGRMLYRIPQGAVATERLTRLMADHETADDLARHSQVWFDEEPPPVLTEAPDRAGAADRLRTLEVRDLTVRHHDGGRGVTGVDLRVERGSFTVVTGAVGAGKTTLVRALLGLLPATSGTVRWNDEQVDDPGTFLVPGRVAYAGQVPRLFSDSLRENLLLGWPADGDTLANAMRLAALERDLAEMPEGLETVVGPRGVRLSGGQVQRATAARALVRNPDLLVVDDLSSALDVETEHLLWDRIADAAKEGRGPETVLVVSHRRAALQRADQVVVLDRGRVVGSGPLPDLLATCPEMRRLWAEELVVEAEEDPDPATV
ncbi:ABC transporter ATP-binding protein [Actinopolymorpha singaporensis]|uniref:ATP-binding cassette, subfamily B n=1 Tax=Actinopolymorpha singaporensis TaxID=117157 RepID=A0A1H1PK79_9ACTN|nr:ABC transporter ATP-binding protein [Actinopolymorpha singaporensis]SDS11490.1 ATP-binding cassette, subfamily B [Actinopolymorpha singaporensis]